ncbi:MAG: NADP-dependent oxidoreductase [Rubrivivax sp.]|nr:NADP-dependent oxidoreductase [Rubrivivax sp.]
MPTTNIQMLLVSRPTGEPGPDNFRLVETPLPALKDGQVLVRHHWLSLDPYMRGRMSEEKSYAQPQPLGAVMIGGTAGVVATSRHPGYAEGDAVVGMGGWQAYSVVDAATPGLLRKVDATRVPLSAYLGAVGMPGVTAWMGLTQILTPKEGQTIAVSAASGAVGSMVGQLAKARGCRVVGVAGGPEKCGWVTATLGFDACVDHKRHGDLASMTAALREAAPRGIDGYFDNVGGLVLDGVMAAMNDHGRIAVCGMIAGYNGAPMAMANPMLILRSRLLIQGFIVSERMDLWPAALKELADGVAEGRLKYRETIAEGLAAAPEAFVGLLKGRNFGKQLVKLA